MPTKTFDVVGIGNAIVDVLSYTEDDFLEQYNMPKGGMRLIDEAEAESLYADMGPATECSGGSVANTLAGMASLGAKSSFIGKVKMDQLGTIFYHGMKTVGVDFETEAASDGPATARCLIYVTPDGERTMNTFIGACVGVSEKDIDADLIAAGKYLYIEGYLWDPPEAIAAIRKGLEIAATNETKVAFSLSDAFCVDRHRASFHGLIDEHIDVLFANADEIKSLMETDNLEEAILQLKGKCDVAAITDGEKGCTIVSSEAVISVPTAPVMNLVDTTGAGDLFAAGFLYGLAQGWSHRQSAELGNRCAGEIIQQLGARTQQPLNRLIA